MALMMLWLQAMLGRCASAALSVPDSDYFTDRYLLAKDTIQLVENHSEAIAMPALAQHNKNCTIAENKARERFRSLYPQSQDNGRRLSAHFGRNAGCTVRMAFRLPP